MTPPANVGLGLEVSDLVVAFDDCGPARVVLDVSRFSLRPGSHVALCGPSGAGKTTLLHVLAAIERPRIGEVRWGAIDILSMSPTTAALWRRETVGLVFQQFHLFSGMSAVENVLLPARFDRWRPPPTIVDRANWLLERVGVRARARVETLSRGEMQRVAVARALAHDPAVVLADEPTASLDRDTAAAVEHLLCTLCRESGATLIVATHDERLAAKLDARFDILGHTLRSARSTAPVSVAA